MADNNSRILILSDMHIPYNHPDLIPFLTAVKKKYKPTRVISVGDEVDKHAMSFHDSDPDLMSAGDELLKSIKILQPIYKLFPAVDLVDSNHGSMAYRKGKAHGIPRKYIRSYGEVLDAPDTWTWHNDLTITLPNKQKLYICHGMSKNGLSLASSMGMCTVQGHYHTEFNISYGSSPSQLYWSMMVGCLIDDDSLAFHYNKITAGRPIIGLGMIIDSHPVLIPMVLNNKGRWDKKVL